MRGALNRVSFHNFKSQKIKLSVSNPKSKYVAYVSALSRISNCQSLGRKNKFENFKTDRTTTTTTTTTNTTTNNNQLLIITMMARVVQVG